MVGPTLSNCGVPQLANGKQFPTSEKELIFQHDPNNLLLQRPKDIFLRRTNSVFFHGSNDNNATIILQIWMILLK